MLDKRNFAVIILRKTEHLIKSGGGNGPVKPGNLRKRGAKSGGDYREMRLISKNFNPSVTTDFFVDMTRSVFSEKNNGGKRNEQKTVYIRIRNRGTSR